MRKATVNILLIVGVVAIFALSFIIGGNHTDPEERFPGSDGAATAQITEIAPDYKPWFSPFFEPASGEIESGLFALQAGLGGIVLGFAIGGLWGRNRRSGAAAVTQGDEQSGQGVPAAVDETPQWPRR